MANNCNDVAKRPIGIFDSGIGGLTVVREITKQLPVESLVYFGDTARVPYGSKSDRAVREFAWEDSLFLLGHGVKLIVVACNTVSALALDELERYLKIPVIGVIKPGAKAAASMTHSGRIGVIGTQATIDSGAYEKELKRVNPQLQVLSQSCPLFVPLVEEGWTSGDVPEMVARQYLSPMAKEGVDVLILGCTHYPLLKPLLTRVLKSDITLVDSAEETAREVLNLLEENHMINAANQGERRFFVSDLPRRFESLARRFLGEPVRGVSIAEPWKGLRPIQTSEHP